ncbi:MAG: transposon-transfer assisting family protein [Clostridia bacterium]|nr:transposon-transfer assisting family protein [Clostridia bacterium]
MNFTHDEINLMAIYNPGTRKGLIAELTAMRKYLESDEAELLRLTDSVLSKLSRMTDAAFTALDLIPDFDETEDMDAD